MDQQLITRINGADIVTVEREGEILVPIKPICQALGIEAAPQRDKIQNDDFFSSTGTIIVSVGADGKSREMFALPLKFIYGWLATINPGKVAPEAREAVARYRRECYDVLYEHFTGEARRQKEQNRREREIIDRKAAFLERISEHKEAISALQRQLRNADTELAELQNERTSPVPALPFC